jgi:hypothetical protein
MLGLLAACDRVFGLSTSSGPTLDAAGSGAADAGAQPCPLAGATPDEDGDGCVDDADNCPGIANADQADGDADGVGDACDPHPSTPGDRIAEVAYFDGGAVDGGWIAVGPWTVAAGSAAGSDGCSMSHDLLGTTPTVELRLQILDASAGSSSIRVTLQDDSSDAITCHVDDNDNAYGVFLDGAGDGMAVGSDQRITLGAHGSGTRCVDGDELDSPLALVGSDTRATITLLDVAVAIDYIAIYDVR